MPDARARSHSIEVERPIAPFREEPERRDPAPTLTPAARLLHLAAGGVASDEELRRIAAGGVDWRVFLALATIERAVPVVWRRVRPLAGAAVPPEVATRMERLTMIADFKSLQLEQRLGDVLALLARAGIGAMLLKGAALAHAVHHSFTARPMLDLDLLVAPDRAEEAHGHLRRAGWAVAPGADEREGYYAHHHHLAPLIAERGGGSLVELHTELFSPGHPFRLSAPDVRARSQRVTVNGRDAIVPGPHDLLLHNCLHFAWSHMLRKGAWRAFYDAGALIGSGRIEWDAFVELAKESRGATCCYWTLRLAKDLAWVRVPARALEALRPPLPEYVVEKLQLHFLIMAQAAAGGAACPSLVLEQRLWELAILPVRSGHGAARPWHQSEGYDVTGASPTGPAVRLRRAVAHLGELGRWTRYCRALIREETAAPSR